MSSMGVDPDALISTMREGIEQEKQRERTPVEIYFYHCDHLGTPIALTDRNGQIAWAARLDPWGNIEEEFNPRNIEQNIRLPGQYHDRETGLYYNLRRYYDSEIGSYINQDPIGLKGGLNKYAYAQHNPVNTSDPLGLFGDGQSHGQQFPGHGDFYCSNEFDYVAFDHGWTTNPYVNPSAHFRPLPDVERDLQTALNSCDRNRFQDLMHQGQDHFSHYRNGYRWDPGNTNLPCNGVGHACDGTTPDNDVGAWNLAENWTTQWADKWMKKCRKENTCTFR
jgi:RHS repeat-associated protein